MAPATDAARLYNAAAQLSAAAAAMDRRGAAAPRPDAAAPDGQLAQRVATLAAAAQRAVAKDAPPAREWTSARGRTLVGAFRGVIADRRMRDHALRLGLCMGVAFATKFFAQGPHWYWVPLTVAIALKPDFGSVAVRALQRCIGTVGGVIVGGLALAVLPRDLAMAAAAAALAAALP